MAQQTIGGSTPGPAMEKMVAMVVGAGQTPGTTIGNGRATALLLAREGATVLAVDRHLTSAEETVAMIEQEGGRAAAFAADITDEDDCRALAEAAIEPHGHIDVLVNNVGIGTGDAGYADLAPESWDLIHKVNLRGMWLTCKHVLPAMSQRGSGSVVNISSAAAVCAVPMLAYAVSKAGVNALTQQLAMSVAASGVRVNAVMPGLIDTPMAIEGLSSALGIDQDELRTFRDALVPFGHKQGTAWDVANAVVFLASPRARFITGVVLPVDGGQQAKVG